MLQDNENHSIRDTVNVANDAVGASDLEHLSLEPVHMEPTWQDALLNYSSGMLIGAGVICGLLVFVLITVCSICCHYRGLKTQKEDKLLEATARREASKKKRKVRVQRWFAIRRLEPSELTETSQTFRDNESQTSETDSEPWYQNQGEAVHSKHYVKRADGRVGYGPCEVSAFEQEIRVPESSIYSEHLYQDFNEIHGKYSDSQSGPGYYEAPGFEQTARTSKVMMSDQSPAEYAPMYKERFGDLDENHYPGQSDYDKPSFPQPPAMDYGPVHENIDERGREGTYYRTDSDTSQQQHGLAPAGFESPEIQDPSRRMSLSTPQDVVPYQTDKKELPKVGSQRYGAYSDTQLDQSVYWGQDFKRTPPAPEVVKRPERVSFSYHSPGMCYFDYHRPGGYSAVPNPPLPVKSVADASTSYTVVSHSAESLNPTPSELGSRGTRVSQQGAEGPANALSYDEKCASIIPEPPSSSHLSDASLQPPPPPPPPPVSMIPWPSSSPHLSDRLPPEPLPSDSPQELTKCSMKLPQPSAATAEQYRERETVGPYDERCSMFTEARLSDYSLQSREPTTPSQPPQPSVSCHSSQPPQQASPKQYREAGTTTLYDKRGSSDYSIQNVEPDFPPQSHPPPLQLTPPVERFPTSKYPATITNPGSRGQSQENFLPPSQTNFSTKLLEHSMATYCRDNEIGLYNNQNASVISQPRSTSHMSTGSLPSELPEQKALMTRQDTETEPASSDSQKLNGYATTTTESLGSLQKLLDRSVLRPPPPPAGTPPLLHWQATLTSSSQLNLPGPVSEYPSETRPPVPQIPPEGIADLKAYLSTSLPFQPQVPKVSQSNKNFTEIGKRHQELYQGKGSSTAPVYPPRNHNANQGPENRQSQQWVPQVSVAVQNANNGRYFSDGFLDRRASLTPKTSHDLQYVDHSRDQRTPLVSGKNSDPQDGTCTFRTSDTHRTSVGLQTAKSHTQGQRSSHAARTSISSQDTGYNCGFRTSVTPQSKAPIELPPLPPPVMVKIHKQQRDAHCDTDICRPHLNHHRHSYPTEHRKPEGGKKKAESIADCRRQPKRFFYEISTSGLHRFPDTPRSRVDHQHKCGGIVTESRSGELGPSTVQLDVHNEVMAIVESRGSAAQGKRDFTNSQKTSHERSSAFNARHSPERQRGQRFASDSAVIGRRQADTNHPLKPRFSEPVTKAERRAVSQSNVPISKVQNNDIPMRWSEPGTNTHGRDMSQSHVPVSAARGGSTSGRYYATRSSRPRLTYDATDPETTLDDEKRAEQHTMKRKCSRESDAYNLQSEKNVPGKKTGKTKGTVSGATERRRTFTDQRQLGYQSPILSPCHGGPAMERKGRIHSQYEATTGKGAPEEQEYYAQPGNWKKTRQHKEWNVEAHKKHTGRIDSVSPSPRFQHTSTASTSSSSPGSPYFYRDEEMVAKVRKKYDKRSWAYRKLPFPTYPYYPRLTATQEENKSREEHEINKYINKSGYDYQQEPERKVCELRRLYDKEGIRTKIPRTSRYPHYPCASSPSPPRKREMKPKEGREWVYGHPEERKGPSVHMTNSYEAHLRSRPSLSKYSSYPFSPSPENLPQGDQQTSPKSSSEWNYKQPPERKVSALRRTYSKHTRTGRKLPLPEYANYPCSPPYSPQREVAKVFPRMEPRGADSEWDHMQAREIDTECDGISPLERKVSGLRRTFSSQTKQYTDAPIQEYAPQYSFPPTPSLLMKKSSITADDRHVPETSSDMEYPGEKVSKSRTYSAQSGKMPFPKWPHYPCSPPYSPSPPPKKPVVIHASYATPTCQCGCENPPAGKVYQLHRVYSDYARNTRAWSRRPNSRFSRTPIASPPQKELTEDYLEDISPDSNGEYRGDSHPNLEELRRTFSDQARLAQKLPFPEYPYYPCPSLQPGRMSGRDIVQQPPSEQHSWAAYSTQKDQSKERMTYQQSFRAIPGETNMHRHHYPYCPPPCRSPSKDRKPAYQYRHSPPLCASRPTSEKQGKKKPRTHYYPYHPTLSNSGATKKQNQRPPGRYYYSIYSPEQSHSQHTPSPKPDLSVHRYPSCPLIRTPHRPSQKNDEKLVHHYPYCPPVRVSSSDVVQRRPDVQPTYVYPSCSCPGNTPQDRSHYVLSRGSSSRKDNNGIYENRVSRALRTYGQRARNRSKLPFPKYPYYPCLSPPSPSHQTTSFYDDSPQVEPEWDYKLPTERKVSTLRKHFTNQSADAKKESRSRKPFSVRHLSRSASMESPEPCELRDVARRQKLDKWFRKKEDHPCRDKVASLRKELMKTGVKLSGRTAPRITESTHLIRKLSYEADNIQNVRRLEKQNSSAKRLRHTEKPSTAENFYQHITYGSDFQDPPQKKSRTESFVLHNGNETVISPEPYDNSETGVFRHQFSRKESDDRHRYSNWEKVDISRRRSQEESVNSRREAGVSLKHHQNEGRRHLTKEEEVSSLEEKTAAVCSREESHGHRRASEEENAYRELSDAAKRMETAESATSRRFSGEDETNVYRRHSFGHSSVPREKTTRMEPKMSSVSSDDNSPGNESGHFIKDDMGEFRRYSERKVSRHEDNVNHQRHSSLRGEPELHGSESWHEDKRMDEGRFRYELEPDHRKPPGNAEALSQRKYSHDGDEQHHRRHSVHRKEQDGRRHSENSEETNCRKYSGNSKESFCRKHSADGGEPDHRINSGNGAEPSKKRLSGNGEEPSSRSSKATEENTCRRFSGNGEESVHRRQSVNRGEPHHRRYSGNGGGAYNSRHSGNEREPSHRRLSGYGEETNSRKHSETTIGNICRRNTGNGDESVHRRHSGEPDDSGHSGKGRKPNHRHFSENVDEPNNRKHSETISRRHSKNGIESCYTKHSDPDSTGHSEKARLSWTGDEPNRKINYDTTEEPVHRRHYRREEINHMKVSGNEEELNIRRLSGKNAERNQRRHSWDGEGPKLGRHSANGKELGFEKRGYRRGEEIELQKGNSGFAEEADFRGHLRGRNEFDIYRRHSNNGKEQLSHAENSGHEQELKCHQSHSRHESESELHRRHSKHFEEPELHRSRSERDKIELHRRHSAHVGPNASDTEMSEKHSNNFASADCRNSLQEISNTIPNCDSVDRQQSSIMG